jgi:hypothetical protein
MSEQDQAAMLAALEAICDCDLSHVPSQPNLRLLDAIADAHNLLVRLAGNSEGPH